MAPSNAETWHTPDPEDADFEPEPIQPLSVPDSVASWQRERSDLLAAWRAVVGAPGFDPAAVIAAPAEVIEVYDLPEATAALYRQPTTPAHRQAVLVLTPKQPIDEPCPGMVVPFYDPDRTAGIDLATGQLLDASTTAFGRHLAAQGYIVVCSEAYPFNTVEDPGGGGMSHWQAAADRLRLDEPAWSGVGRLAWDASRALDLLLSQAGVDARRCGIIGHSLGGKIAFYAAGLDERFAACVASDFGFGFGFTNWDDDWYLGPRIHAPDFERGHHELLALIAPRPFFLVGGEADRAASWNYLQEGQRVYALYGRERDAGFLHHRAGHQPPADAMHAAYGWLAARFGLELDTARLQGLL